MIGFKAGVSALILIGSSVVPAVARAETIGACVLAKMPASERDAFRSAYRQNMQAGMAQLSASDVELRKYAADCSNRSDLPKNLIQMAVAASAIQDGAAAMLGPSTNVSRSALDSAWADAPTAAKDCWRANAAKVFGLSGPSCPAPKEGLWFLQRLGISLETDRGSATQVLYFMNAKAQEEWAESLVAQFAKRSAAS